MNEMELIAYVGVMVVFAFLLLFYGWIKTLRIVTPSECHIISKGKNVSVYDGNGSYHLLPVIHKLNIIPKGVIEIESSNIKAHDSELLPFEVEVACKIKVVDGLKAAESFGEFKRVENFYMNVKNYVEDTIFSAMRSAAMHHSLLDVMKQRDEIEDVIYTATVDALAKIGISVVLFDIKNIVDTNNSTVLKDLERVKSAELKRTAREAEAIQDSYAKIIEAKKKAEAEVAHQESMQEREVARIQQEMAVAEKQRTLSERKYAIIDYEAKKAAEIEKERLRLEAEAEAQKLKLQAEAEAEQIRLKAQAEADAIRMRMEAEAEGTQKIAEALKALDQEGMKVRMAEIQKEAIIEFARAIADGLRQNSKVFLPISNGGNFLESLLPGIAAMQETGLDIASIINNKPKKIA